MTWNTGRSVIAVDGGGTRCRLVLAGEDKRHLIEVGSANVSSNFSAAIEEISTGLSQLASNAEISPAEIAKIPTYLGLAGVTGSKMVERVAKAVPLAHVIVQDDRPAALRGALGDQDGAVAHCGTGSFYALQSSGTMRFAGGWGPRLGDEGSAYWVGRRALSYALDVVDGLVAGSDLTDEIFEKCGDSASIVAFANTASPAEIGQYAKAVTRHANLGDYLAQRILSDAASVIADVLLKLGWLPNQPLCMTGGIARVYKDYLPSDIAAAIVEPVGQPIDGAIALARNYSKEFAA